MAVASTSLRRAGERRQRRPLGGEAAARRAAAAARRSGGSRAASARRRPGDLRLPRQEHQHPALGLGRAPAASAPPPPPRSARWPAHGRSSQRVSTGQARPSAVTTGAPPISSATGAASSVADITRSSRSGRSAARTSSASASPRSACSARSWNSSKITQPTPGSSGSDWIIRVRMPSVTTSIAAPGTASPRMRKPTAPPDRLAEPLRQPLGGGAGGDAARLQHQDAARNPGLEQVQRHPRRLAGAGRRLQHRAPGRAQRRPRAGSDRLDRQRHRALSRGARSPRCRSSSGPRCAASCATPSPPRRNTMRNGNSRRLDRLCPSPSSRA